MRRDATENPSVAVIVLNWNNWRDTFACLSSLRELDYANYEPVVVDNGSTDGSEERVRANFSDATVIQAGANLGFAGGNNVGIKYALQQQFHYVWLLNNDTVADPSALTALVDVAQSDTSCGAVGSVLYSADEPKAIQAFGGGWIGLWTGISRYFKTPVQDDKVEYITGASLLIRRNVLENVGLLEENFFMYWEDADYGFRVRKAGWKLAVAPESKVWHKEFGSVGGISPALAEYYNASAVLFFTKHSSIPFVPIIIGVGGRMMKRIVVHREWERTKAVWRGALAGYKKGKAP